MSAVVFGASAWRTPGARGVTGATGPAGANGSNGASGAGGSNGANGSNGASGAAGATGPKGATGPTGTEGAPKTFTFVTGETKFVPVLNEKSRSKSESGREMWPNRICCRWRRRSHKIWPRAKRIGIRHRDRRFQALGSWTWERMDSGINADEHAIVRR